MVYIPQLFLKKEKIIKLNFKKQEPSIYNLPKTHFKYILIDVISKLIDKNIPYIQ